MIFTFPLPVNLANSRLHWRTKHMAKKAWTVRTNNLLLAKLLPSRPPAPWPKAIITAHIATGNTMDFDNMVARCKWAIDWLVTSGYLVNDHPSNLRWSGMPTQEIVRKAQPFLRITLEADV